MLELWQLYKSGTWVEDFLSLSIDLFVGASFILYIMIIWSRNRNIKQEKLRAAYTIIIEKLMFSMIFEDTALSVIKEDKNYITLSNKSFFREVAAESIINLHKNYEGIYAEKLEDFFKESGLINDSIKKLRSFNWEIKCKGITELAEMNVTGVFDKILAVSKARNKTLKITALNACVKLAGVKGIVHLTEHPFPIDEWTQINIIHAFKKHDIGDTKGVELLLESQNTTVVTLGLKLIKELKLSQKAHFVAALAAKAPNAQIQYEAENILQALNS
ncbi:hypothetical protein [Flavobacterium reichenbachii]|uniref:HEAT repeat domain-containing protein n=1 Tax=Flavobacterium reichenbachii TaxID=362418 RepID=A0A085ZEW8_9FLAO|nr:hypothetical protein [Flavobacterium reichenbachii]KFF02982.1 hypothetical protein IW19_22865 [Flavobacterium reichenbachii]OXB16974.1 hypothetical protein B0A68_06005 [Flavobacterium reichenbachii]